MVRMRLVAGLLHASADNSFQIISANEVSIVRPRSYDRVPEFGKAAAREQVSDRGAIRGGRVLSARDALLSAVQECPARNDYLARENVRGLLLSFFGQRGTCQAFR